MQFVDVTNDIAFRKIFGNENKKATLVSFLNAVLDFKGSNVIEDVKIENPYQLPNYSGGKMTIVDVKATDQNKNIFIVEMQVAEVKDFDKRVLYYASQSYTDQIKRGDLYPNLKPAYLIAILDFQATQNTNYLSRHKILDTETGENVVKDIEFTFIELTKFTKTEKELISIIDQWVYFIKNAENLDVIPEIITDNGLKEAFEEANRYNWSKQELDQYNKVFIREQDERGRLEFAENKGITKGMSVGKIEGKIEEKYDVLDNGIEMGLSLEQLSKLTGLAKNEIEEYHST